MDRSGAWMWRTGTRTRDSAISPPTIERWGWSGGARAPINHRGRIERRRPRAQRPRPQRPRAGERGGGGSHGDGRWRPGAAIAPRLRCRSCSFSTAGTAPRIFSWKRSCLCTKCCSCPIPSPTWCWTWCCSSSTSALRPRASSLAPRGTCVSGRCHCPSAWHLQCRQPCWPCTTCCSRHIPCAWKRS